MHIEGLGVFAKDHIRWPVSSIGGSLYRLECKYDRIVETKWDSKARRVLIALL